MAGLTKISLLVLVFAVLNNATSTTKEVRTTALSEKIIGGVIDLVHSHKNKPASQQTVPQTYPSQSYQPQYPQYQQWNGQPNYQGQGFNYQTQQQTQGQYSNGYTQNAYTQATTYPQNNGNYASGQVYPTLPVGGITNGQTQSQGQYQIVYQNPPNSQPQYGQTTAQYQNTQQSAQFQGQNQATGSYQGQTQPTGSYQGLTQPTGSYQGQTQPTGSYQGQTQPTGSYPMQNQPNGNYQTSNLQGQNGSYQNQGSTQSTVPGGQHNQNYQVPGGQQTGGNAGGPTCVCQAWTKPTETLNNPAAEKAEKIGNGPAVLM